VTNITIGSITVWTVATLSHEKPSPGLSFGTNGHALPAGGARKSSGSNTADEKINCIATTRLAYRLLFKFKTATGHTTNSADPTYNYDDISAITCGRIPEQRGCRALVKGLIDIFNLY